MLKSLIRWAGRSCSVLAIFGTALAADPLLTNSNNFRIPFAVDGAGPTLTGSAVLYVGTNGGPLEQVQTVSASAGGFQYSAPSDGRYAFAVRMTDNAGNVVGSEGSLIPELEVVVDTVPPKLTFQLTETGPGQVGLNWNCSETEIVPGSLRLEYAEGADGRWKTIPISPAASGNTSLTVQVGTSVEVRGFISDLAGNQGNGSAQTVLNQIHPTTSYPAARNTPDPQMSIPNQTQAVGPSPFANSQAASAYDDPSSLYSGGQANSSMNPAPIGGSVAGMALPTPGMSAQAAPANTFPNNNFGGNNYGSNGGGSSYGTPAPPISPYGQPSQQSAFNQQPQAPLQNFGQLPSGGGNFGNYGGPPSSSSQGQYAESRQIVSNQVFNIDYQVDDVGPSGVSAVELFVTENGGRDWFRYGNDLDMRTPFEVDTRGEGTFGFAVRARNGIGFSQPAPQPGEQPTIVVTVDKSSPVVELGRPQVSVANGGSIRLQWRVSEQHPATSPIRLEYATSNSGPWTPVFDWQADQGSYQMPIQSGMPPRLHFRLLARDVAGNVTASQTNQPVMIDQRRPTARLLRVQPVSRRGPIGF